MQITISADPKGKHWRNVSGRKGAECSLKCVSGALEPANMNKADLAKAGERLKIGKRSPEIQ